jgi:hypothetical protein
VWGHMWPLPEDAPIAPMLTVRWDEKLGCPIAGGKVTQSGEIEAIGRSNFTFIAGAIFSGNIKKIRTFPES